jgi:hypothetical protein
LKPVYEISSDDESLPDLRNLADRAEFLSSISRMIEVSNSLSLYILIPGKNTSIIKNRKVVSIGSSLHSKKREIIDMTTEHHTQRFIQISLLLMN